MKAETLNQIYGKNEIQQAQRYQFLSTKFQSKFNEKPEVYVRSPGRVNLIGEHIDYSGFPVLPMALDRDVVIALSEIKLSSSKSTFVVVSNLLEKYKDLTFLHSSVETDSSEAHGWHSYFFCAYKALIRQIKISTPKSFNAMIDGVVPTGAGVSSSAALCCASVLAISAINDISLSQEQLINISIEAEHMVGVKCGGMDQSISVMGQENSAVMIHFYPKLKGLPTPIPSKIVLQQLNNFDSPVFVVANTLKVSDKHETAATNYNLRVVETALAGAILFKKLNLVIEDGLIQKNNLLTLRQVMDIVAFGEVKNGNMKSYDFEVDGKECLNLMLSIVEQHLKSQPYTREEVALELGISVRDLVKKFIDDQYLTVKADKFELYKRAKHVYSETLRVLKFDQICTGKEVLPIPNEILYALGNLMNESQSSCRDLFNCSCDELDELVKLNLSFGAFGSRLTGAGWGGCTVSLVGESMVDEFVKNLKDSYFTKEKLQAAGMTLDELNDVVFYCKPGTGSRIVNYS
ncbi:N-acetylgalactosamine kinase [Clydaea vesicula]|uniref:N-acetylgalactosamine kinase n=1 Tax=Clydaea vesicula TaxID=447962 RepID=A0AAD5XXE3_9FUNG|nr:N-acetylgalactosamine kinase [Clydaea vesicula]KAJ3384667.1 N-acetylgalactosamine kinase [Lobulomyces angularis]